MPNFIQGMDELLKKLGTDLPRAVGKTVIARAVRAGSMVIREEAERRAPRGETGLLAEEEMVTVTEQTSTEAIGKIGPSKKAFYGVFAEGGTVHSAPQPFLEPAFDATIAKATRVVGDVLAAEIKKVTK